MACCTDASFVTSRQAIQHIQFWAPYAPEHVEEAAQILMKIDVAAYKESQHKLLLQDICDALIVLKKLTPSIEISDYIHRVATGGILDKKTAKRLIDALP